MTRRTVSSWLPAESAERDSDEPIEFGQAHEDREYHRRKLAELRIIVASQRIKEEIEKEQK